MSDPIKSLRSLINMFKQPYLLGVTEGGIENAPQLKKTDPEIQDMDNYDDGHEHIDKLFRIIADTIAAGGTPPPTNDVNAKSVNSVFEKKGIWPALRADPSLKERMTHFAILDLRTYPDTLSMAHIDEQNAEHVEPAEDAKEDEHDTNMPNEANNNDM